LFFLLIGVVFWISSLHDRPDFERRTRVPEGSGPPSPTPPRRVAGTHNPKPEEAS
jgi:hypothetical protein